MGWLGFGISTVFGLARITLGITTALIGSAFSVD
jgi:hypothetical protein